jgi:hypothetical protein
MSIEKFKPPVSSGGIILNKGKLRSTSTPFQQRINEAKAQQIDPTSMPHRLCLMLDRSSSMQSLAGMAKDDKPKIEFLKDAIENFVTRCNFNDTSLSMESFPTGLSVALTSNQLILSTAAFGLTPLGSTPMFQCVQNMLTMVPMTRAIIVSDGEATDWHDFNDKDYNEDDDSAHKVKSPGIGLLKLYKEQGIPIDCVHIGDSTSGEELLRRIALQTGGIYMKFTDVGSFAKNFAYLTPGYRAMLTDGSVSAESLGAKEIKG